MNRIREEKGFTLLEVVVAMMILGITISAVFQLLAQSKRLSIKSDQAISAVRIMNNLLSDTALMEKAKDSRESSGEIPGETGWEYRITVESPVTVERGEEEEPYENESLGSFHITVVDVSGLRERSFSMTRWLPLGASVGRQP